MALAPRMYAREARNMLNAISATTACVFLFVSPCFAGDRTVIVGDAPIHLVESGTGPAVIFESGMGEGPEVWNDVLPPITKSAHTVGYDRPGIGQSPATARPRTVMQMAIDLHDLLHAAKIDPPYVLVGHSLGGAIIQVFCHRYPDEIAGLVLVDPEDGRLIESLHARMSAPDWTSRQKALEQALPAMPPPVRAELEAAEESGSAVSASSPFPSVPIVLLTGTKKNPEFPGNPLEQDLKLEFHNALVEENPQATHVLVPDSRHYIQNDAPEVVIQAVKDVLKVVRPR
jgi:pimeloyl-ACP methyl ester carboxylesterase